jgi:hypothetical protein
MLAYGIIVVPAEWTPDDAVGFSDEMVQKWGDQMDSGLRLLIYKNEPVNAIVAEGVMSDRIFQKLDEWPGVNVAERPMTGLHERATYLLPLRILYTRAEDDTIPVTKVRERLNDPDFPDAEFRPLDLTAYGALTNWP